jgi:hypothetical protein
VRYQHEGNFAEASLAFDGKLLADIEGRTDAPVALDAIDASKGRATWTERSLPRVVDFEQVPAEKVPAFSDVPDRLRPQPPVFLRALAEAAATAARDSARVAVSRIQLRGRTGELVGTDGRQLLLQGGFTFPWKEDILVPALPVFACPELPADGSIAMGRTATDLVLRVGPWTFTLAVDTEGRFPKIESVIPKLSTVTSRLLFDPADAAFLIDALPRLPGEADDDAPISIELSGQPKLQAWSDDSGPVMEVALAGSSAMGPATRIRSNRQFLRRALQLDFTELHVSKADQPVCCRDRHRCYVWVPLTPNPAAPADREILRISHDRAGGGTNSIPANPRKEDCSREHDPIQRRSP